MRGGGGEGVVEVGGWGEGGGEEGLEERVGDVGVWGPGSCHWEAVADMVGI